MLTINDLDTIKKAELPKSLDAISFDYKGISFHVYGVLHGLTGGTNKEYIEQVNHTIHQATGIKLAEKSMKLIYKGLDEEVDDWIQMPFKDTFKMTFNIITNPFAIFTIIKTLIKEKTTKKDRFGHNNQNSLKDIGGSMAFHLFDPNERRIMAGFPSPIDYLRQNILRRENQKFPSPVFPDPDWHWLNFIEPFANIPARSIHMIETSVNIAKKKNIKEVSLFIGEIHNTDIFWYVNRHNIADKADNHPIWLEKKIADIIHVSNFYAKDRPFFYHYKKFTYLLAMTLGAIIPISILLLIICLFDNI